jgi:hypothetical protein
LYQFTNMKKDLVNKKDGKCVFCVEKVGCCISMN